MADLDLQKIDLRILDSLSKFFAVAIGAIYLIGFLVVSANLSRYGVSGFSVLQLQYLIAGGWALAPLTVPISMYGGESFKERAAPIHSKNTYWSRFVFVSLVGSIPFGVFYGLLAALPGIGHNFTSGMGFRLILFGLAFWICVHYLLTSWRVQTENETWLVNRRHAAPFYFILLVAIALGYVLWFSARIYPLIPFSLGGGRPLTIAFIAGEKKLPDLIKTDVSAMRSIPYQLLVTTDKSYVVISQEPNEKSIEVSRESVAGILVLEEPHAK
jgi:hypothetical protein